MSRQALMAVLLAGLCGAAGAAESFAGVRAAALRGDYQAQRNLAFGYTSMPYPGQDLNPLLGCAWRLVILHSGSERVDITDVGNVKAFCGQLDQTSLTAAQAQARSLFERVYRKSSPF